MFVLYPSIATSLFSMFYCVNLEETGESFLRVDFSLECSTSQHAAMLVFTLVMLGIHTIGTPLFYAYLFFWKHYAALKALKEQVGKQRASTSTDPHTLPQRSKLFPSFPPSALAPPLPTTSPTSSVLSAPSQELTDSRKVLLEREVTYVTQLATVEKQGTPQKPRVDKERVLPGYMHKLTGGYEYRTCTAPHASNAAGGQT